MVKFNRRHPLSIFKADQAVFVNQKYCSGNNIKNV